MVAACSNQGSDLWAWVKEFLHPAEAALAELADF